MLVLLHHCPAIQSFSNLAFRTKFTNFCNLSTTSDFTILMKVNFEQKLQGLVYKDNKYLYGKSGLSAMRKICDSIELQSCLPKYGLNHRLIRCSDLNHC